MTQFNALLRGLVDLLLLPFSWAPPSVSLIFFSLLFAILALLVYRRFSNQEAIAEIKQRMAASFFEIRLFNDDVRALFRAQGDLLRNNLRYMGHNLKPLVVMLVPMFLLFAQLQFLYGYEGLPVAEPAVLVATLSPTLELEQAPRASLAAAEGLRVDSDAVWVPSLRQLAWRISGEQPGSYEVAVDVDGWQTTKNVVVDSGLVRRSPIRQRPSFFGQLLYPAEDPIDSSLPFESITIDYRDADVSLLGFATHWSIWLLVLSIVFAFALRKRFGVTF